MKTRDAVDAFKAGKRSPEIAEALGKFDKGLPIWKEGAPLDMVEALEVREHIEAGGQPPPDHVTSAELCAVSKKRIEADPSVRGVSLFKGVSTDIWKIDWNGISRDLRLLIAEGVDEVYPSGPTGEQRRHLTDRLRGAGPSPEWAPAKKRLDKMTAGQKESLESERLYMPEVLQRPFAETPTKRLLLVHTSDMAQQVACLAATLKPTLDTATYDVDTHAFHQMGDYIAAVFVASRQSAASASFNDALFSARQAGIQILHLVTYGVAASQPNEKVVAGATMTVAEGVRAILRSLDMR